jgi:hypothetical protein
LTVIVVAADDPNYVIAVFPKERRSKRADR